MRVVIDCNVLINAAVTRNNTSSKAIRLTEELHEMLLAENTLKEFLETILKPKFDKFFHPIDTRFEIISRYSTKCEWVIPFHHVQVCRDPKDDMYLELALSGKADCIITNDSDLLVLNPFENIPIITPKEFLEQF